MANKKIKAIVFDMDGVLVDAKEWHYQALNRALDLFGVPIAKNEHLLDFEGLPTKIKLDKLISRGLIPAGLSDFVNKLKQQYTTELVHQLCKPLYIHEYTMARLVDDGYKLAVASNSIRATVDLILDKTCLEPYFEFTLSNQDVQHSKPSPEMYLLAFSRLGLAPDECLILEDSENGKAAAKASGAHLMEIVNVEDVDYFEIKKVIENYELS